MGTIRAGYKETSVGVIPEEWEIKKLGEVLTISYGKDQKKVENDNGKYPILGTGGCIGYTNEFLYNKPSVLIGRKGTIDKPKYMDTPFWTVDTLFYTEISDLILPKLLFYIFQTINWYRYNEATGVPSLSASNINSIQIPLPPLPEQKKIAAILTATDQKIACVEEQILAADELKKGLMQKLFSEGIGHTEFQDSPLGKIPKGWVVKRLEELPILIIDGDRGVNYPKSDHFSDRGFCLFLNAKNVSKTGFKFNETQFITKERDDLLKNGKLEEQDIVITTRGTVGNIAFNNNISYKQMRINSGMVILRNQAPTFSNTFLYKSLTAPLLQQQLQTISSGSAQPQLTVKGIKTLKFLIPPIAEQQKIADILMEADKKIAILKEKKAAYQELKKGLMQKLLTGEIRVTVDADG